jgi:hypothetical protein
LADEAYAGLQRLSSGTSEHNQIDFVVRSIMSEQATAMLVVVKAVNNTGGVAPVGLVDVQPMVAQLDGKSQATPHGTINNVPYFRLQGGQNAVIMDPAVGDIGLAVFASHDISSVKNTKAAGNPGSRRRFDWADGLYIGGFLNGTPTNYIRFDADGNVTIKPAATVTVEGDLHCTGTITGDTDVVSGAIHLKTHKHLGVTTGGGTSGTPTP